MAHVSINIHNTITGITQNGKIPGHVSIEFHNKSDSYFSVDFFTDDQLLSNMLVAAFKSYEAAVKAADIADRERDNIANGQDIDVPEDDNEPEF